MATRQPVTSSDLVDELTSIVALLNAQKAAIQTNRDALSIVARDIGKAMKEIEARICAFRLKMSAGVRAQRPPRPKAAPRKPARSSPVSEDEAQAFGDRLRGKLG
ncbi:hypothetical protein AB7M17_005576 [Bradyrhizobium sp. USDA 377]